MTDPEFAHRTYIEPMTVGVRRADHRARAARRDPADARRPDRAEPHGRALRGGRARALRRGADRRAARVDPQGRGPRAASARRWSSIGLKLPRSGYARYARRRAPRCVAGDRPPRDHPARASRSAAPAAASPAREEEFEPLVDVGARAVAEAHLSRRAERARLEGVRARGDARRRRQRRHHLLDRELRPDGRAHRRLDHGGAGPDADRPRVPGDARRRDRDHPRDRRRHRRLEHPVRGEPDRRHAGRDRDEPARVALVGAGVEGDRLPDREDRREARGRLHARRDPERHHARDAGLVRAVDRLRRDEDPALHLREVPGRRRTCSPRR